METNFYETKCFVLFDSRLNNAKPIEKPVPVKVDLNKVETARQGYDKNQNKRGTIITVGGTTLYIVDDYDKFEKKLK